MEKGVATVVKVERENQEITSLTFDGFDESFKNRRAGSFLSLKIQIDGQWSKPHPFTISCAPEDPLLKVTIKKAGPFTQQVHQLQLGDQVILAGPFGLFCKDIETSDNIVMIAGGVGVTPFLSVLRHFRSAGIKKKALLIWSNRTLDDALALDELKAMTREFPLRVVHNLSRVEAGDQLDRYVDSDFPEVRYEAGRCTKDIMKKHMDLDAPAVFLCGPPPMQEFILSELEALGIDQKSVKKENFTWQGGK
ncbi:MAG TPA: FAD/NAD-binding family oxidoreductase [Deltaproteobacteria bacterium]|jgi:ferredoxin-NADP reductase|nr:FAD/NAD-binding family oxidoreductase [Deltaproteobacteria bacterium]HOI08383.1 FAD/NAD-binding family oxidoreductase [Deltaproteobacteria bacterium]